MTIVSRECLVYTGKGTKSIQCLVLEDGIVVSKQGICLFLKRYSQCGTIARKPGSGFPPKILPTFSLIVEQAMHEDDETTATQLQVKLAAHGVYVCLARGRHQLGWTYRGSAYCQLIQHVNKQKRILLSNT